MNILFTICGRAGSKGIKNKNIRNFLGKPLPYYTLSAIDLYKKNFQGEDFVDVVVNTDSDELIELMENNNFFKVDVIKRDAALGGDTVSKIQVIQDCMDKMQSRKKIKYDMVVDLDITSPLRTKNDINNLITVQKNKKNDVTFSVTDSRRNPYFNMVMNVDGEIQKVLKSDFVTRQQAPTMYDMNASLYAYNPEYLNSGKGVLDGKCGIIKMYDTAVLDLDHENDFELMEVIAKYLFEKNDDFAEIVNNIHEYM